MKIGAAAFWSFVFSALALSLSLLLSATAASAGPNDPCPSFTHTGCTGCYEATTTVMHSDCKVETAKKTDLSCGGSWCETRYVPPVRCAEYELDSKCTGCYEKTVTKQKSDCTTAKEKVQDFSCSALCETPTVPPVAPPPSGAVVVSSSCTGCYERTVVVKNADGTTTATKSVDFSCSAECETTYVPPVSCTEQLLDNYRCSPNGKYRQRLKQLADCTAVYVNFEPSCEFGCVRTWADTTLPVSCDSPPPSAACMPSALCSTLGCGNFDSCGNFCGACPAAPSPPPAPADSIPSATISVPASAAPSALLSIAVTGTDDADVAQLLLFNSAEVQIASFDCSGIQTSCSSTFTVTAPSAFSTSYAFKARSKDSAGQLSGFVSGSGTTTAAPAPPAPPPSPPPAPPAVPPVAPPAVVALARPLQEITVKFPLQPLFMRSLSFPDSGCVKPGESALLAVKVQNNGRATLNDVKFIASVPELGIRASDGPVKLTTKDKSTRFLRLEVPEDADEGTYYLRFTISNNRFNRIVHRTFAVDSSC